MLTRKGRTTTCENIPSRNLSRKKSLSIESKKQNLNKTKQPSKNQLVETERDPSETLIKRATEAHQIFFDFLNLSVDLKHAEIIKNYFSQLYLFFIIFTYVLPFVFNLSRMSGPRIFSLEIQYAALSIIYIAYLVLIFIVALTRASSIVLSTTMHTLPIYIISLFLVNILQIFYNAQSNYNSFISTYFGSSVVVSAAFLILLQKKSTTQKTYTSCLLILIFLTIPFILMLMLAGLT